MFKKTISFLFLFLICFGMFLVLTQMVLAGDSPQDQANRAIPQAVEHLENARISRDNIEIHLNRAVELGKRVGTLNRIRELLDLANSEIEEAAVAVENVRTSAEQVKDASTGSVEQTDALESMWGFVSVVDSAKTAIAIYEEETSDLSAEGSPVPNPSVTPEIITDSGIMESATESPVMDFSGEEATVETEQQALSMDFSGEEATAMPVTGINLPTEQMITADIPTLVGRIIKAVLGIVGSVALLMFIYGGFLYLTAAGVTTKVKKGQQVLTWATIGLVVIFISYATINFVINSLTGVGEESIREKTGYTCSSSEKKAGGVCNVDGHRRPDIDKAACLSIGNWQTCD